MFGQLHVCVPHQPLVNDPMVVDVVLFHHLLAVRLEHSGHLNRELLDALRGVLGGAAESR